MPIDQPIGSPSQERLKVACLQMRSGIDRMRNIEAVEVMAESAAASGATLLITPEMTNSVDRDAKRLRASLEAQNGALEQDAFSSLAKRLGVHLLVGSIALLDGEGDLRNRSLLFAPDGALVAHYDKIHMFDVELPGGETWRESAVYKAGDRAVIKDIGPAHLGLSICYDVRFPSLYRRLSRAGAHLLAVPAAFTKQTGEAHWKTLLSARAIENGAFVLAVAQGGHHEDGRDTYGHSMVVDPWGKVVAEKDDDAPGVLLAELDLSLISAARTRIPSLLLEHANDVDIFVG
ncbi:MAG: carbon-nitrogen hydrolase family protein [Pseudomonadota bacterium]